LWEGVKDDEASIEKEKNDDDTLEE